MPKSRHRRKGTTRRTSPSPRPHPEPRESYLPWLRRMIEVDVLESRGDAAGALRLVEQHPEGPDGRPFWRPPRVRRLAQLVALGESAPAWAWARWVVAQAAESTPGRPQDAIELAVATRGGASTLWGVDRTDAMAKVIDHDWVYRQLVLHEHGGLAVFLGTMAGPELLARAFGVRSWVDVPMGAYEFVDEDPHEITWFDLVSGRIVRTPNLGAATMLVEQETVLGRLVESDGVTLFESAPLRVPGDVAERVAAQPSEWVDAVSQACGGPSGDVVQRLVAKTHDFDLLCDLSARVRRQLITPPDPGLQADELTTGGNGVQYDAALVLAALGGAIDVEGEGACECDEPCCDSGRPEASLVAAALLEPGTVEALAPLLVPRDAGGLRYVADLLPAPADELCLRLARRLEDVA